MWPEVRIGIVNQLQGEVKEIERHLLFIGIDDQMPDDLYAVNSETNFDDVFKHNPNSVLRKNLDAAKLNAGPAWYAHFIAIKKVDDWRGAVIKAQERASFEGVVFVEDADKKVIQQAIELRQKLLVEFNRWTWFMLAVPGLLAGEKWNQVLARLATLQQKVAAPEVQLVPKFGGNEPGVLAGRLCNKSVTIADSPARVKTGPLIGFDRLDHKDADNKTLSISELHELESNRYSVPMWYPDYEGYYWADGRTLDAANGDFQCIETLRIVDKVARRIRLQAIAKIADRSLNSTPTSIEIHKQYFAKTMRDMSISSQINGIEFPGEVKPPKNNDVVIVWESPRIVNILVLVRTYECPKGIKVSILVDASLEGNK